MAVAIVHDGKVIYLKTLGVRNVTSGEGVTPDTLFQIGSLSKAFTATYIAQLVDNGTLNWNDIINDKYPYQLTGDLQNTLTIGDALSHSSGLPMYSGNTNWIAFNESYDSILSKFSKVIPEGPFPKYEYNNIIYTLPAYLAEKLTGTTWFDAVTQNLLRPLDMNTAVTNTTDFLNSPNHAASYKYTAMGDLVEWHPVNIDTVGPSGSMGASINDMINWLKFQLADTGYYNGVQIVSKENLDETKTGHIDMGGNQMYGYGWIYGNNGKIIAHSGSTVSSESTIALYTSNGTGIVILTNQYALGMALHSALFVKFSNLINGINSTDSWPALRDAYYVPYTTPAGYTPSPYPFSNYIGVYNNAFYGKINVTVVNNGTNDNLVFYYGNNSVPFTLRHDNCTVFMDDANLASFEFANITNGKADKLWMSDRDPTLPAPVGTPTEFNRTPNT